MYYYVPQVYPYVNYYPVYDMSRQYEWYRQKQAIIRKYNYKQCHIHFLL